MTSLICVTANTIPLCADPIWSELSTGKAAAIPWLRELTFMDPASFAATVLAR